ncbi:hypothetical protein CYY_001645 [Polysphondylium violaceum]|uniref:Ubiquinone biosynthesis O-methyltransferase, mitochondrial n=1 Tax=Polysphondylium violaceum TaxID=133409 RepID=A0A8J4PXX5_9MYCE|nr:hypothetical protein CYY_001645 [Polysphondylium violaceum]
MISSDRIPLNTINQREIDFFDNFGDWWSEDSELKGLREMNPIRVQYIMEQIKNSKPTLIAENPLFTPLQGLRIADIGCGPGFLTESLSRLGAEVVGLDLGKTNIAMARAHANNDPQLKNNLKNGKLVYMEASIETLLEDPRCLGSFDIVCSMEVLEHVDNPLEFVRLCSSLVKTDGHIFLSTINRTFASLFYMILMAEYVLRLIPIGTHHHRQFINPKRIISTLTTSQFVIKDLLGLKYNPVTRTWRFDNDTSVNYILHAIKQ